MYMLRPFKFGDDFRMFRAFLRKTASVISGSFAFAFIFGDCETRWVPRDMDLYVCHTQLITVLDFMFSQGFRVHATHRHDHDYSNNAIDQIVRISNGTVDLDVVSSRSDSSIAPLFQFHSSLVMNYLSADTVFSAYPSLIARNVGFSNPMVEQEARYTFAIMDAYAKWGVRQYFLNSAENLFLEAMFK
ncbi:hypothetical protein JVU11DRAFT_9160 [Chiua virens]|nr:hypothetical protein JVU11DRAFT_9160 [Chiua virens]